MDLAQDCSSGAQFDDPEIRLALYHDLVSALGVQQPPQPTAPADLRVVQAPTDDVGDDVAAADAQQAPAHQQQAAAPRSRRAKRSAGKKSWQRPNINFRPDDKQSFADFAKAKQPNGYFEKNLVAVYYMQHVLGLAAIDVGHVLAAYDAVGWKASADPENSPARTASGKRWLETSDMKAIRTTHNGENRVKYEMPATTAALA